MSRISITTRVPVVATPVETTETVVGERLPTELVRLYMGRKVSGQKLGRDFWAGARRDLRLDPGKKYKVRIVGVVLEV